MVFSFAICGSGEGQHRAGKNGGREYFKHQMVGRAGGVPDQLGSRYRIYLIQDGKRLIILFGGVMKSSQTADIKRARILIADHKAAKKQRDQRGA